jgi:hypothetical protein
MPTPAQKLREFIPPPALEHNLFESTSLAAGHAAMRHFGKRCIEILTIFNDLDQIIASDQNRGILPTGAAGACLFEVAQLLSNKDRVCHDHQISGRFTDLKNAHAIERTGQRRPKPATGFQAEEYRITLIGQGILKASLNAIQTPPESVSNKT